VEKVRGRRRAYLMFLHLRVGHFVLRTIGKYSRRIGLREKKWIGSDERLYGCDEGQKVRNEVSCGRKR